MRDIIKICSKEYVGKRSSINDVKVLGGEGVEDFLTIVLSKALVILSVTMRGAGRREGQNFSKIV